MLLIVSYVSVNAIGETNREEITAATNTDVVDLWCLVRAYLWNNYKIHFLECKIKELLAVHTHNYTLMYLSVKVQEVRACV